MLVRLQKYLADCGVASRRACEKLILEGRVSVNGERVTVLGTKLDTEREFVTVNGRLVRPVKKFTYIMLHKPRGYVTTAKDQFDRPTVLDLVSEVKERIVPVGRLDYDTSGLLLLTNDGDVTYALTHPKHSVEKVYVVRLKETVTPQQIKAFNEGIEIDGYKTAPAKLEQLNAEKLLAKVTLWEGRNRQVRKMLAAVGHNVLSLKRISVGKLTLGDLKAGEYRHLTNKEVDYIKKLAENKEMP